MKRQLILIVLIILAGCAFTCNAQTQPSAATPTSESLQAQCNALLAARGYVVTGQAGEWTKTVSGITQTWKLSKITVEPPKNAGDPTYGFILLDKYEPGEQHATGSFAEGFAWDDASHQWVPLLPSVVASP